MGSLKIFLDRKLGKFPSFMICTVLEWTIIVLLFVDGFIAYVTFELAKLFELSTPCLLCSRIKHVLNNKNPNSFYNHSICELHRKDISSLAYCHVHKKLSDLRSTCQRCLWSFAISKDSDAEKYKSLVGILQKGVDFFGEDDRKLFLKTMRSDGTELSDEKSADGNNRCSCCGEPVMLKSTSRFRRNLSINSPVPSPRALRLANRIEEKRDQETPRAELKPENDSTNVDNQGSKENVKDSNDDNEEIIRTPTLRRRNKDSRIISESVAVSPRFLNWGARKSPLDSLTPNEANTEEADAEITNRSKGQNRLENKSLMELYMELDEERSASAVAANNAMAMITRLQAEKAALQMEALQYQRVMEEEAKYDEEAMQEMQEMLEKKDDEIQALESELDMYRIKYGSIKIEDSEYCEIDGDEDYQDINSQLLSPCSEESGGNNSLNGYQNELSCDFEGERSYLLGLLTDLERKMHAPSEAYDSTELYTINKNEEIGNNNRDVLASEACSIRERLRALEGDNDFLKHASAVLQRGDEGTKLLTEIAQHLRKLRRSTKSSMDSIYA